MKKNKNNKSILILFLVSIVFFGSLLFLQRKNLPLLSFLSSLSMDLSFSNAGSAPATQSIAYDFLSLAPSAYWHNNAGGVSWPSIASDPEGARLLIPGQRLEDGTTATVLFTHPKWISNGFTHGAFSNITIPSAVEKPVLRAVFGYTQGEVEKMRTSDGIHFFASFQENGQWINLFSKTKIYTGSLETVEIDLSPFAGKTITIFMGADAGASVSYDWAAWKELKILKNSKLPEGAADSIDLDNNIVEGWSRDNEAPSKSLQVMFYIDGVKRGEQTANRYRADLGGNYGFRWTIPEAYQSGEHSLKITAKNSNSGQEKELLYSPTTYNYTTGVSMSPITLLYNDAQMPVTMDSSMATIGGSASEMDFFVATSGQTTKFKGNLYGSEPFKRLVWQKNNRDYIDMGNFFKQYACAGIWIENIYQKSENFWLGFVHVEKFKECNNYQAKTEQYSIGLMTSTDKGESWKFIGEIIKAKIDTGDANGNLGGTPVLLAGEYFYTYFWDNTSNTKYVAVARANIQDVLNNATQGKVTSWKKYNNGAWVENGLTGAGSPLGDLSDSHTDATVSASNGKYLMTQGSVNGLVKLMQSSDGIHWSSLATVDNRQKNGEWTFYSTIVNESVPSNKDSFKVGNTFFVIWPRKQASKYDADDLYMRRITLRQNTNPSNNNSSPSTANYEKLLICPTSVSIKVGGKTQLQARIYKRNSREELNQISCKTPYSDDGVSQRVVWESASSNVKVSNYSEVVTVTGLRAGAAKITASYGNNLQSTANVTINVK
ncbi:MAG: hypothetical protein IPN70_01760 [Candidatus Moraniibacteriota bacterium]|nr:MAG: hypothetical protein IPN70_01760 [Candidatus Moranbacteria bacterium]